MNRPFFGPAFVMGTALVLAVLALVGIIWHQVSGGFGLS